MTMTSIDRVCLPTFSQARSGSTLLTNQTVSH